MDSREKVSVWTDENSVKNAPVLDSNYCDGILSNLTNVHLNSMEHSDSLVLPEDNKLHECESDKLEQDRLRNETSTEQGQLTDSANEVKQEILRENSTDEKSPENRADGSSSGDRYDECDAGSDDEGVDLSKDEQVEDCNDDDDAGWITPGMVLNICYLVLINIFDSFQQVAAPF